MRNNRLIAPCVLILVLWFVAVFSVVASEPDSSVTRWGLGGHVKYQYVYTHVPQDSVFHSISGNNLQDHNLEARLKISARRDSLDFEAHTQFITAYSDRLSGFRDTPGLLFYGRDVINDDRRWFDLTHEFHNQGKKATLIRLDRLNVAYTGEKTVIRFGRQAISWGNGLLFTPMDIFNPFDPAAVDKEYKTGDDMLYAQYLLENGNDIQLVGVVRRNPVTGEVDTDQGSLAVKYHGFWDSNEFDVLLAEHFGDALIGLGASTGLGGAVLRGDMVLTDTGSGSIFSAVGGASYSWVSAGHNCTGLLEYYYNGFGQKSGDYSVNSLAENSELLKRLARGELFSLGRHYLGVSVMVEATPLLNLTPNLFINLIDPSALAQLTLSYDWKQDIQLLAALNIPIGPNGSEYGGIDAVEPGTYLSTGLSLFTQLAWYF